MRTIISALIAASLAVGLVACAPTNDKPQPAGAISATAEGIDVSVTTPASPAIDATSATAAASAVDLLPVGYLMTRPSEITASGTIPASGVELTLTLPAALPKDTVGRFSYFDEDAGAWVPVETTVSGTTATARVDHLSLWSFIIAGAEDVLDDLAEQFSAVADGVTTIIAGAADAIAAGVEWFSAEVPRWIYRQGGLFLGIQATEPTCSDAPLPSWVEATDISKLTGIADEALPVLRCVEADEDDPSLVRVRAVMNRGYGFQMEFGSSISPAGWEFGVFESALQVDLAALSEVLLMVSKSMPFPSPTKLLSPTNETSFTVSEAQVRALEPEEVVVIFTRPTFDYYAMTVAMKWVVDQVAGQAEGMMAFVVALDSCNYNQVIQPDSTAQPAEWAGFITRCVDELTGDQIEKTMAQIVAEAPDASDVPVKTPASLKTIRKALSALKWLDVVVVALTTIDYAGDVNPLYVDLFAKEIVPPKPVVLGEDANGEWCLEGRVTADGCTTVVVGTDPQGVVTEFTRPVDGCFAGSSYGPMGGGVSLVYCPAGAQVPAEFAPMFANGTNDTTRDRLWPYQGFGALPFYRKE